MKGKHRGPAAAMREVEAKSEATLERETARRWADRAIACYRKHAATGRPEWLARGDGYSHEALEHAALACDAGRTVASVERAVSAARARATGQPPRCRTRTRRTRG